MDIIRVRPDKPRRREFAAWAVARQPKIRTLSTDTFAVPVSAYVDAPEGILLGALVDDHLYVPVADTLGTPEQPQVEPGSEATDLPAAPTSELLGVASPEAFTPPGPATAEQTEPDRSAPDVPSEPVLRVTCRDCRREFNSKRGLRAHRRQAHGEGHAHAR